MTTPARNPHRRSPRTETLVGVISVSAVVLSGIVLHAHPGGNAVDRIGFALRSPAPHSPIFRAVAWLGTPVALVAGAVAAASTARWITRRSRWRSLACLIGPLLAVGLDQLVLKPVVGRRYLGELSYASGSVTVVAGLATAWVLAVPARCRPVVTAAGALAVAAMVTAVVALQWHFPSDALAGVALGGGVVLLLDGSVRTWGSPRRTARGPWPVGRTGAVATDEAPLPTPSGRA